MSRILSADSILIATSPTQMVSVTVVASWSGHHKHYTYTYVVTNDSTSQNSLHLFSIAPVPRPTSFTSPLYWEGTYGYDGDTVAFAWERTGGPDTTLPEPDAANVVPSPYNLQPGSSLTFSIDSDADPGLVSFYGEGFDTLEEGGDEGPVAKSVFEQGVTGIVVGPGGIVGVVPPNQEAAPRGLSAPRPNPTRYAASIAFELVREKSTVRLQVFDIGGRAIRTLLDGGCDPGVHAVTWNGLDGVGHPVASGVYFFKLWVDAKPMGERRLVVVR
ncbi:MAG: hypothetical protein HZB25_10095 [Candidatus Eisenbacteria bacterium]|nr:hypothetical protein [Candidatus Eisenbacteria bacterium]